MLAKISDIIAKKISRNDLDTDQLEVCAYGIETALYTLISTAGLLITGYFFNSFWPIMLLLAIYYTIQTIGGGYHARSHISCFCTMLIGTIFSIVLMKQRHCYEAICIVVPLAFCYLLLVPAHLHPNKSYLLPQIRAIQARSRIISTVCMVLTITLLGVYPELGKAAATGIICSAVSRFVGTKQKYHYLAAE